jgi:ribonuclease BN (tRNA processing enzyme)
MGARIPRVTSVAGEPIAPPILSAVRARWGPALRTVCAAVAVSASSVVSVPASAQGPPSTPAVRGDVILLLGTKGGPDLSRDHSEPATVLIVDGRPYLIDCGIGTMRRLLEAGVPSPTIRTIFLTHDHPDHALGLVDVLANDFNGADATGGRSATGPFTIYGPPQTAPLVAAAWRFIRIPYAIFAAEHLGSGTLADPFRVHVVDRDGLVYQDDLIRVTAAENTHYRLMPARDRARMKSYAYRFETPYGVIVFTGDTGPSAAVERLAAGADVLVSEVEDLDAITRAVRARAGAALMEHLRDEHLPMDSLGALATQARVKAVLLHHYVPPEDSATYVAGVERRYAGPVFAGRDLARYCLGPAGTDAGGRAPGGPVGAGAVGALRPCP